MQCNNPRSIGPSKLFVARGDHRSISPVRSRLRLRPAAGRPPRPAANPVIARILPVQRTPLPTEYNTAACPWQQLLVARWPSIRPSISPDSPRSATARRLACAVESSARAHVELELAAYTCTRTSLASGLAATAKDSAHACTCTRGVYKG